MLPVRIWREQNLKEENLDVPLANKCYVHQLSPSLMNIIISYDSVSRFYSTRITNQMLNAVRRILIVAIIVGYNKIKPLTSGYSVQVDP